MQHRGIATGGVVGLDLAEEHHVVSRVEATVLGTAAHESDAVVLAAADCAAGGYVVTLPALRVI